MKKYPQLSWDNLGWKITNESDFFKPSLTWSFVSSSYFGVRASLGGAIFDVGGSSAFPIEGYYWVIAGFLCSKLSFEFLKLSNPTLNFQVVNINLLPWCGTVSKHSEINSLVKNLIEKVKFDWDSYETSWDFSIHPLLKSENHSPTLESTYTTLCTHWRNMTLEMQRLEEENNRIFIEAYGLQDELTPDVPLNEITLTCNPHYRYGGKKTEDELENLLLTDTIKELISYAIGCMMGRYSLDRPGLIYAHSGNQDFDKIYYRKVANNAEKDTEKKTLGPSRLCGEFQPDDDGIIPIMDQEWFTDDATNRFIQFLKAAWSPETLDENLKFVADALKPKSNEAPDDTIRRYLSTAFFKDHLKTYKKRPIYWLFASGKQKAFQCLVYLHRYNQATLSRMRSAYVTPLQGHFSTRIEFLQNEKDSAKTASAQRKVQKKIEQIKKKQAELRNFDDELRHYADMKIALDLDDGVKVNYGKFGNLLALKKAVTGKK